MPAPALTAERRIVYVLLKVYDSEAKIRSKITGSVQSAISHFLYKLNDKNQTTLYKTPQLRRAALEISASLSSTPTPQNLKNLKPPEYVGEPYLASPTSLDALPSPQSCPIIGLDWQVGLLHSQPAGMFSHHGHGNRFNNPYDLFPLPRAESLPDVKQPEKKPEEAPVVVPSKITDSIEITTSNPSFIYSGDKFALPLSVSNRTEKKSSLKVSITDIDTGAALLSTNIDVEPGFTDVLVDDFEKFLQPATSKLQIRVDTNSKELPSTQNKTQTWTFKCTTEVKAVSTKTTTFTNGIATNDFEATFVLPEQRSETLLSAAVNVGNDRQPLLNAMEKKIVEAPVRSILQRASRVLALCERRRTAKINKSADYAAFDKLLKEDVDSLSPAAYSDYMWLTWLPHGENAGSNSGRLIITSPLVLDALQLSKEEGFDDPNGVIARQLSMLNIFPSAFLNPESRRIQSYQLYLFARAVQLSKDKYEREYETKRFLTLFSQAVTPKVIEESTDEGLAWLVMASHIIPVDHAVSEQLESRLESMMKRASNGIESLESIGTNVQVDLGYLKKMEFLTHGSPVMPADEEEIPTILNGLTALSMLLLASSENRSTVAEHYRSKIAAFIERTAYGGGWINDTTTAICLRSLYRVQNPADAISGRSEISSSGPLSSIDFLKGRPKTQNVSFNRSGSSSVVLKLSPGIRYQIQGHSSRDSRPFESKNNHLYHAKRIFKTSEEKSIRQSADGVWHCKKGDVLTMQIFILPKEERSFVETVIPIAAGLTSIPPNQEITFDAARAFEKNPAFQELHNRWPQKIDSKVDALHLYSRRVLPLLYRFEYDFKAVTAGRFFLPAVEISEVFSGAKSEFIDSVILEIEE